MANRMYFYAQWLDTATGEPVWDTQASVLLTEVEWRAIERARSGVVTSGAELERAVREIKGQLKDHAELLQELLGIDLTLCPVRSYPLVRPVVGDYGANTPGDWYGDH